MEENRIFSLLKVVYKKRRFLIIYFVIISAISIALALTTRKTFTSNATVLPPNSTSLSSFLPIEMTTGLGGAIQSLTGGPGNDTNKMISILSSRSLAVAVIEEFDLFERFEAITIEDAIEAYKERIGIDVDDQLMVRVSVGMKTEFFHPDEEETKVLARDICQFIVDFLDEKFTDLQVEKARFERILIEQRFNQNIEDLAAAEQDMKMFLDENGIIALPEQLEASIQAAAEIEGQIVLTSIEINALKTALGENSPEIKNREVQLDALKGALNQINIKEGDDFSVLPSISESPELIIQYANLERELTVQSILYEFLIQQVEQYKLQEAKDTPSIQFIDTPQVPDKRSKPVRSIMVIGLVMLGMIVGITYVLFIELYFDKSLIVLREVQSASK